MNLLFKRSKKFIVSILLFALIVSANLGLCVALTKNFNYGVNAVGFENQTSITVSNGSFTSYSNTYSYPYSPSNYTFSETSSHVMHGVININKTTFDSNYAKYGLGKDDYPAKDNKKDNYCLMLNSRKAQDKVGYTSNDFTFSKNGSFYVSVEIFTDDIDSSATLYLKNGTEIIGEINNINTKKTWQTYYFFITTADYESLSLNLGLFLGSKSVNTFALFDEVKAGQIPASIIRNFTNGSSVDGKSVFTEYGKNYFYKDFSNENILESLEVNSVNFKDSENSTFDKKVFDTMSIDGKIYSVLSLENLTGANPSVETKEFKLLSNKVYKMSILVKAEDITTGSAFIQAVTVKDGKIDKSSDKLSISSTKNLLNNGFVEYSIIINSDPTKEVAVKFLCGLGSSSEEAIGKVTFADFKLRVVPYSEFSNANSNTQKTLDLSKDYSSSQTVNNFAFNLTKSNTIATSGVTLNEATNWNVAESSSTYSQYAGVFNVKDFSLLDKTNFPAVNNPGFISSINNETNNVMMLHNTRKDVLSVSSSSFNLSSSSYYVLSLYVQTQDEGVATVQLVSDDMVLAEIKGISTNGNWKEYKLYLKTGFDSLSTSLKLCLGTEEEGSNGFAFFDNCILTTNETLYNESSENKFDVSSPLNLIGKNGEAIAFDSTSNVAGSVENKIIDLDEDISFDLPYEYRESAKQIDAEDKKVILLKSENVDNYYRVESKLSYSLASSSYYKFSVDVYTADMTTEQEDVTAGASITLSGLTDGTFNSVISDRKWTTYTFYIATDSSVSAKLSLGVGNENGLCKGMAMFGNIKFEKLSDKAVYESAVANLDATSKALNEVSVEEDEEDKDKDDKNEINWIFLTSTLTAVAVIIAVLGVAFKKVFKPNKKRVKKTKVDYDRKTSVMRQKYRKLAYLKRDKDIRKLEKKEEFLISDRTEKEEKYKELLKKVREVKLANRDGKLNSELTLLNKELAHASREVSKLGVSINKINSEIAYMRTEGYLLDLEKKLRKQDELAKQKGSSIEEILAQEEDIVIYEEDQGLNEAINKADKIIEDKKEEERLIKEQQISNVQAKEEEDVAEESKNNNALEEESAEQNKITPVNEAENNVTESEENTTVGENNIEQNLDEEATAVEESNIEQNPVEANTPTEEAKQETEAGKSEDTNS